MRGRKCAPAILCLILSATVQALANDEAFFLGTKQLPLSSYPACNCGPGSIELTSENYTLVSPNYPGPYPNNCTCRWRVRAPRGLSVAARILSLNLEPHFDFLTFYDDDGERLGRCSDPVCLWPVASAGSELQIEFTSDSTGSMPGGFRLHLTSLDPYRSCPCGDVETVRLDTYSEHSLVSPPFSRLYSEGCRCRWTIQAPPNHTVHAAFDEVSIESGWAHLDFYDGEDNGASRLEKCANNDCSAVTTTGRFLSVALDTSLGGSLDSRFRIRLSSRSQPTEAPTCDCGSYEIVLTGSASVSDLSSPNFPGDYPNGCNCHWQAVAPAGHRVKAEPLLFETERLADELAFCDERGELELCSGDACRAVTSVGRRLGITFTSDGSIRKSGFRIRLSVVEAKDGISTGALIALGMTLVVLATAAFTILVYCAARRSALRHRASTTARVPLLAGSEEDCCPSPPAYETRPPAYLNVAFAPPLPTYENVAAATAAPTHPPPAYSPETSADGRLGT